VTGWPNLNLNTVDYEGNLKAGLYKNGIAIITGKCLEPDSNRFSFALDFDGWDAVVVWFGGNCEEETWNKIIEMSKKTRIEWHQDKCKLHMILFSNRPVTNKKIKIKDSQLEIRCEKNLLFSYPSYNMDGNQYVPLGTYEIAILAESQLLQLEAKIESVCEGYMSDSNKSEYIKWLENLDNWKSIGVGQGRHNALVILGTSYYYRYSNGWHDLTDDDRREKLWEMNSLLKVPKPETEFNQIWKWIVDTHRKTRDQKHEEEDDKRNKFGDAIAGLPPIITAELDGNMWYKINDKPPIFIIADTKSKRLMEATFRLYESESKRKGSGDTVQKTQKQSIVTKPYLSCIPDKIIIHKSPIDSILKQGEKYTVYFVGSENSGNRVIKNKTISDLVSELKKTGNVLADFGVEVALSTVIKAFERKGLLEENNDMDETGFFIDDKTKKIRASNLQINEVSKEDLLDALNCIDELKKYYVGRLDLLATTITWGMVAPLDFMLKMNGSIWLKWLVYWGFSNASKSSSGSIVLGLDGHHNDSGFVKGEGSIDTVARLGDLLCKTTFPKMVNEVDLNADHMRKIVENMKTGIDSMIFRDKFTNSKSNATTPIPSLCPLILTSNAGPPIFNTGFMRRVIDRSFQQSESYKETDPVAVEFMEFLRNNLDRLKPLGDFRNWFVMNNQEIILDKKTKPLDLGLKILRACYEYIGTAEMLEWLESRLPESQLEDSLEDNKVIVKNAFETLITTTFKSYSRIDVLDEDKLGKNLLTSDRFMTLLSLNLLPYAKLRRNKGDIIINKGILGELYKLGVKERQLPDLHALATFLKGEYRKVGTKVIICTEQQLEDYFERLEEEGKQMELRVSE
jgi:hypothetical protein